VLVELGLNLVVANLPKMVVIQYFQLSQRQVAAVAELQVQKLMVSPADQAVAAVVITLPVAQAVLVMLEVLVLLRVMWVAQERMALEAAAVVHLERVQGTALVRLAPEHQIP
tara:strand:- start:273 stop:608 length:336 start_codon:yes stop_codon:yes gene_type:complete